MDPSVGKMLFQLGTYGPLGIMAVLFFLLYVWEKKRNEKLSDKLYEVSLTSIKADMEHSKAFDNIEKTFDAALKLLTERR